MFKNIPQILLFVFVWNRLWNYVFNKSKAFDVWEYCLKHAPFYTVSFDEKFVWKKLLLHLYFHV